jgi:hypothetical protein
VIVRFAPEALFAVRDKRAWWEQHREKAPRLFVQELAAAVAKLREGTDADRQKYAARGGRIIWRLLMPRTRHHIYYRVTDATGTDATGDVEIITVWNAVAAAGPEV